VKRILVGWFSGGWTQKCCDRFGWWPLRLSGEITSAEGLHDWGRQAVPLLNYILEFALQLRKSTENLSQCSRVDGDYSFRRLGRLFMDTSAGLLNISPPRLPVGDFSQPVVGTSFFQVAELRDSPNQPTLCRNSQTVLWCGRRSMESPNPREFAC
jgi:hypothetical protein